VHIGTGTFHEGAGHIIGVVHRVLLGAPMAHTSHRIQGFWIRSVSLAPGLAGIRILILLFQD